MNIWTFLGSAGKGNDDFELLQSMPMREGIIGTDPSCAWRLTDPMLTQQHARVLTRDGAWYVGGIAVASPTRVNGVPTVPGEAVRPAAEAGADHPRESRTISGDPDPRAGTEDQRRAWRAIAPVDSRRSCRRGGLRVPV